MKNNLYGNGFGNDFFGYVTKSTGNRKKNIDKLNYIRIKNLCASRNTVNRVHGMGENIWKLYDKGLIFSVHTELLKLNNKKVNNPI